MVNFPAQIPDCNSYDHVLLDFLFLLTLLSVIQWISHLPEILIHVVVSVSTDFLLNSKRGAHFYWDGLHDHMKDVPREDIFKLGASAAAEFCEWFQVGIDVYIPHQKYQANPFLSLWFSATCAAAMVHRNYFFSSAPTE